MDITLVNQIIIILGTAMLPVSELRGAIPIGIAAFHIHPFLVYVVAVIGNMIPVFFLLIFWSILEQNVLKRSAVIGKFSQWLFERTRKRFYTKYRRFGHMALLFLVAIPLPATGAWTGSLAAWLFGIPRKEALWLIFLGVLIAGIIVTGVTLGIIALA